MKKLFTFLATAFISSNLIAQIPNSGFESWTTVGAYSTPDGWANLDSLTNPLSIYTCTKGTPGNPGSSYLQLTSKTTPLGVAPGVAVSGQIDYTSYAAKSGFANTARPVSLTGAWQYMAYGSDQGHIAVLLSKWNTSMNRRDTVAFVNQALAGMVMSWANFTIPLTYYTGAVPDSAIIVLSSSGTTAVNNSYLYVDNLAFTGSVPAGISTSNNRASFASVYPNPANTIATITYNSNSAQDVSVMLSDITGKEHSTATYKTVAGLNKLPIDVSTLPKGIYFIKVISTELTEVQQLIIQ